MPKRAKELSAIEVSRLTHAISKAGKPYNALHPVGGVPGLLLQVTPAGTRSWILRVVVGIKRRSIGLGPFPDVTLAKARELAREMREKITESGIDPIEHKQAVRRALIAEQLGTITFDAAAAEYIGMKAKEFKNPRQAQQWQSSIDTYASPIMGQVPVREIELAHIKAVLDPIWLTKTETAKRLQGRIENILGWCAVHGYRTGENPARWQGYLDEVFPSPEKVKGKNHHAALPVDELPDFIAALGKRKGQAARALEFLILTAARTNEVIGDRRIGKAGITWGEIDVEKRLWTIPADRMKSGLVHRVPLCDKAIDILNALPKGQPDSLLFTGPDGGIPSNAFLLSLLKRMEVTVTVHGFRSTFKDWALERTAYPDELSEMALAHVNDDKTRAAYARSELIEKRRQLMADWETFCYHGEAVSHDNKVIGIGGTKHG